MALRLRVVVLAEDRCSVAVTHVVVHRHLEPHISRGPYTL